MVRRRRVQLRHLLSTWWTNFKNRLSPINVIGVMAMVCLMAASWNIFQTTQLSESNKKALCALRVERLHDVEESEKFLAENPGDKIVLGEVTIARATIEDDLNDARETVAATDHLSCPEDG